MIGLESNQFFHQGKRARSQGLPRTIDDGRLTPQSREAWKAGWDWQDDYLTRPEETPEEKAQRRREVIAACEAFKERILCASE